MRIARKITDLFSDRIWTLDTSRSSKLYAWIVRTWKIIRITFRTFTENRMGFQCVSLSYFITLALVPFIAFAFAVTGGHGAGTAPAAIPAAHAKFLEKETFAGFAVEQPPASWRQLLADPTIESRFADLVNGALRVYDWTDL